MGRGGRRGGGFRAGDGEIMWGCGGVDEAKERVKGGGGACPYLGKG